MTVFSTFETFLNKTSNKLNHTALDAFFIKN